MSATGDKLDELRGALLNTNRATLSAFAEKLNRLQGACDCGNACDVCALIGAVNVAVCSIKPTAVRSPLMLLEEVAEEMRTSVASVRLWIRDGRLKSVKPGRRRMVFREDLERFQNTAIEGAER